MNIERTKYLEHIRRFYDSSLIKVLTGIRRCGKSVLMKQIQKELVSSLKVDPSHILSIDFEDVRYSKIHSYLKLNEYVLKRIKDGDKYYLFLDEIQHVNQFEKTLASLRSSQNISIFVTGSNSKLLSGRLASLLVGRCKEFKIMPFSYEEFLQYYKQNGLEMPSKPLNNYLRYGGMPQRFDYDLEEDIREYLASVYQGIVEKDICNPRSRINKTSFGTIAKYVLSNASKEFSPQSVVDFYNRSNGEKVYKETVYRYLEKLEQACLISRVRRYDISSKRTLKAIEKQFIVDNGFLLACGDSNAVSASHALKNLVYNELIYRGYEVRVGKTYKGEIDFVVMKDQRKCFLQVAYLLSDQAVVEREFGAFSSIRDAAPKYVLSLDDFDMSRDGVRHLNLEDWLLHKADIVLL